MRLTFSTSALAVLLAFVLVWLGLEPHVFIAAVSPVIVVLRLLGTGEPTDAAHD
jgi:hypothetical protein